MDYPDKRDLYQQGEDSFWGRPTGAPDIPDYTEFGGLTEEDVPNTPSRLSQVMNYLMDKAPFALAAPEYGRPLWSSLEFDAPAFGTTGQPAGQPPGGATADALRDTATRALSDAQQRASDAEKEALKRTGGYFLVNGKKIYVDKAPADWPAAGTAPKPDRLEDTYAMARKLFDAYYEAPREVLTNSGKVLTIPGRRPEVPSLAALAALLGNMGGTAADVEKTGMMERTKMADARQREEKAAIIAQGQELGRTFGEMVKGVWENPLIPYPDKLMQTENLMQLWDKYRRPLLKSIGINVGEVKSPAGGTKPANPKKGDKFTLSSGRVVTFDGTKWG